MNFAINEIDETLLDILKEVGNVGAGNAATSLSKIINRRIEMNVPEAKIVHFWELENLVECMDNLVVGIYLEFTGDIRGTILYILDIASTQNLISILIGESHDVSTGKFSDLQISALQEVGNILSGAYLGALTAFTGLHLMPSVPVFAFDMVGAILSVPMIEFGQMGDKALFIQTDFSAEANQGKSLFMLIPHMESYPKILKSLGKH